MAGEHIKPYRYWLQTSADGLVWAAMQIPRGRSNVIPLPELGDWPAARIVFQMMWEEREITLPLLRGWHSNADVVDVPNDGQADVDWIAGQPELPEIVADFQQARREVLALLADFGDDTARWSIRQRTPWGQVSLTWLVERVYQQTLAYTVRLLDMVLYWDLLLEAQKQARLEQADAQDDND